MGGEREISRVLVSDIDGTLLNRGRPTNGLSLLRGSLAALDGEVRLIYATGRTFRSTMELVEGGVLPSPHAIAAQVGAEVWLPPWRAQDRAYDSRMRRGWDRETIEDVLDETVSALKLQPPRFQTPAKISFFVESRAQVEAVRREIARRGWPAQVIYSGERFLDVMPQRAGKLAAVQHILKTWGLDGRRVLAAGDSGNDLDMLSTDDFLGVAVGNAESEIQDVIPHEETLYASDAPYAAGVLEGANALNFWPERPARSSPR